MPPGAETVLLSRVSTMTIAHPRASSRIFEINRLNPGVVALGRSSSPWIPGCDRTRPRRLLRLSDGTSGGGAPHERANGQRCPLAQGVSGKMTGPPLPSRHVRECAGVLGRAGSASWRSGLPMCLRKVKLEGARQAPTWVCPWTSDERRTQRPGGIITGHQLPRSPSPSERRQLLLAAEARSRPNGPRSASEEKPQGRSWHPSF